MAYLLDANVFIEAKNRYYGLDFCPAFWDWLVASNAESKVLSIDKVEDELQAMADELWEWASTLGDTLFRPIDAVVPPSLGQLAEWMQGRPYRDSARAAFLESADYYLVAYAHAHGHTVVTHEVPAPSSERVVKIPDACIGLGVKFTTPFNMLSRERARFILGAAV